MKRMKMMPLLLAIGLLMPFISGLSQTKQEKEQIYLLERQIKKDQRKLAQLERQRKPDYTQMIENLRIEIDSLDNELATVNSVRRENEINLLIISLKDKKRRLERKMVGVDNSFVDFQIDHVQKQIIDLQNQRDLIFMRYSTTTDIPKEVSQSTVRKRERGNTLRREEMVISKMEINLKESTLDSGYDKRNYSIVPKDKKVGYKVIIDNEYWRPITFEFVPKDGGEYYSVNVRPTKNGKFTEIYLLPGMYDVHYKNGGTDICLPRVMHIDGVIRNYQGVDCFNYAWMPSMP